MIAKATQNVQSIPRRVGKGNLALMFSRREHRVNERRRPPGPRPIPPPPRRPRPPSSPWLPVAMGGLWGVLIIALVLMISGRPAIVPQEMPTPGLAAVALIPTETTTLMPATRTAVPTLAAATVPPTATEAPLRPTSTPEPVSATATPTPAPVPDAVVVADTLNVRAGPGTSYETLARVHKGDPLDVTGKSSLGDWLEVVTGGNQSGWVLAELVTLNLSLDAVPVASTIPPSPTPAAARVIAGAPGIGQPARGNIWEVTVLSVEERDSLSALVEGDPDLLPGAGKVFLVVSAKFKNISGRQDSDDLDTRFMSVVDSTGTTYPQKVLGVHPSCAVVRGTFIADMYAWQGLYGCTNPGPDTHKYITGWWSWEISPGGEANSASYGFIIPANITGLRFKYTDLHDYRSPVDPPPISLRK